MSDSDRKREAELAIAKHLREVGGRDWGRVQEQFADIPRATFFRMVKRVRSAPPETDEVRKARARLRKAGVGKDDLIERAKAQLPDPGNAMASPAMAAKQTADWNLLLAAQTLYRDAELLRGHASRMGDDGTERILSPKTFTASVRLRNALLDTCLKILERAYEVERTRQFYDALIAEVSAESPAVVERIVARLTVLNERMGFTYAPFAGVA